ncbi:MAG: excinuclease ABC subunit UvrA [Clostridia bacterium]|nr:excinuclease ABC subunit UvrA [Clostridia bacterium]
MKSEIIIKGARENNLKGIDITIPRDKLIVFTGLSGSGKSSLAFDTIYAEGQRRYVESLSSYARQFLGQMQKPDVDFIGGLSPAISIDQKTTSKNPRSTVGTVTEIYDYLRLLYARVGVPHCPECGKEIKMQTVDQITDSVKAFPEGTKLMILSPVIRGKKGEHQKLFEDARKNGYVRVYVDGEVRLLDEEIKLDKKKKHNIEIVVDRLSVKSDMNARLAESLETALNMSGGLVNVLTTDGEMHTYSRNYACHECGISLEELEPRLFSFNSPFGACPECAGLGFIMKMDPDRVITDWNLSVYNGGIDLLGWDGSVAGGMIESVYDGLERKYGFDLHVPIKELSDEAREILFYGSGDEKIEIRYKGRDSRTEQIYDKPYEGIIPCMERRYAETNSEFMKYYYELRMSQSDCSCCRGKRLKKEALAVTVGGINIHELTDKSIGESRAFLKEITFGEKDKAISAPILREIDARLGFLIEVGLDYLTLSRASATLSGGEAQRIRLATQIGSGLTGVLYILDEPSIGLHQRDNGRLITALKNLRDMGNTLIVVEHDEETMREADHIVDIGPGAGIHGGLVVAEGSVSDIEKCKESITGDYLSGRKKIEVPSERRKGNGKYLEVLGARENNLKNINVKFPLGKLTSVTGVSGSGKSTLVNEILQKSLARALNGATKEMPGRHKEIKGIEYLDKVINIDQSPIGRTPRSNPATYTGVFGDIRELFASTNEAKARGYGAGRFSFNVKGGRCEACSGDGILKIEMHFLSDIYVPCEVCGGKRYSRETLEVRYKGKNIYEVLEMSVEEGLSFFENIPKIKRKLQTLYDVGLGYIKIGQSSTTLSGGEAQRVKLSTELSKRPTGKTVYILDEPTTGLHTADVHRLIEVLQRLTDAGNTVIVIEHNLDVIKVSDHIIDLGPEGGNNGGRIVAEGTPEQVAENKNSVTGEYLKKYL